MKLNSRDEARSCTVLLSEFAVRKDGSLLVNRVVTDARVPAMMSGNTHKAEIKHRENFLHFTRTSCAFSPSNAATFFALRLLVVLFPREEYSLRAFFLSVAYRRYYENWEQLSDTACNSVIP
jgi:hypothetical protein